MPDYVWKFQSDLSWAHYLTAGASKEMFPLIWCTSSDRDQLLYFMMRCRFTSLEAAVHETFLKSSEDTQLINRKMIMIEIFLDLCYIYLVDISSGWILKRVLTQCAGSLSSIMCVFILQIKPQGIFLVLYWIFKA